MFCVFKSCSFLYSFAYRQLGFKYDNVSRERNYRNP
jgi:hypothetical protein